MFGFRVFTCDNINWRRYFEIHESALKMALLNQDYSFCVYKNLRYSVLDEAIAGNSKKCPINYYNNLIIVYKCNNYYNITVTDHISF